MSKVSLMQDAEEISGEEFVEVIQGGQNRKVRAKHIGFPGPAGPVGPQGPIGKGLNVLGRLSSTAELAPPEERALLDTYVIDGHFWARTEIGWEDLGTMQGVDGRSAYHEAVDAGFVGTREEWLASLNGADGIGIRIMGSFTDPAMLPDTAEVGDSYIIDFRMWVWDGEIWSPVGQVGAEGKSAYQVALQQGFVGTVSQWLASLKGKDAYAIAKELGQPNTQSKEAWLASLKGEKGDQGIQGVQGPQGIMGPGVKIMGRVASVEDLPYDVIIGEGYLIGTDFWGWTGSQYENLGPIQGPKGDAGDQGPIGLQGPAGPKGDTGANGNDGVSAYQVAVEHGFTGTADQWLASLQGEQGLLGPRGPAGESGRGLVVLGTLNDVSELPATPNDQDTYLVGVELYSYLVGQWENLGRFTGQSAYEAAVEAGFVGTQVQWIASLKGEQGIQGLQGEQGIQGLRGERGERGISLKPMGVLASTDDLANVVDPQQGEFWTIDTVAYMYDGVVWVNLGTLRGRQGYSAYEVAKQLNPAITNEAEYMAFIKGEKGNTGEQGLQGEVGPKGDPGIVGEQGPQGPTGAGVTVMGKLLSTAHLPATGTLGEGYIIDLNFWVWTGEAYEDVGPIQGPQGDRGPRGDVGPQGPVGLQGAKGDPGEAGSKWILFSRDPGPIDGRPGDNFLNTATLAVYLKSDAVSWSFQGYLGGGNVYDAPSDDVQRVRLNGGWSALDVLEAPEDDKQYVRINGNWVELPVKDVAAAAVGYYVRTSAGWLRLDRYDVKVAASTGALDLAAAQVFTLNGAVANIISFVNAPGADRAMTVVVNLNGSGAVQTWPASIAWTAGSAPTSGAVYTVVTLFWTGARWIGSATASG